MKKDDATPKEYFRCLNDDIDRVKNLYKKYLMSLANMKHLFLTLYVGDGPLFEKSDLLNKKYKNCQYLEKYGASKAWYAYYANALSHDGTVAYSYKGV